ncbi:FtsK/SpoIIIE domain-containing protein [Priestia aryabhattai]|uniref:FtsK/SpoIIIE domain-containing protein n=1 Tax=Priestia aryabhattai TaxID=412384 RepID=UPI003C9CFB4F
MIFGKKKPMKDTELISLVFKNVGVGYKRNQEFVFPTLIDQDELDNGTRYIYQTTIGLPDKILTPLKELLSKTLNKPVSIEYEKYLRIMVYNESLPEKVYYHEVPREKGWLVPLGRHLDGWEFHNFEHTPHMSVAGTTRFGKTVMLKNMMTYLIENHPDDVRFIIIDLKGGLEFDKYKSLKQVESVSSDRFEALETLLKLNEELDEQMRLFKRNGWTNIVDTSIKKRTFIIVDEAAGLTPESWMDSTEKKMLSHCLSILGRIAKMGGGVSYRLIYCTQYPTNDAMPRSIKQTTDIKIAFRLPYNYASEVAIGEHGAEKIPSKLKGRAIVKTHETREFQTPLITDEEMWKRVKKYAITKTKNKTVSRTKNTYDLG